MNVVPIDANAWRAFPYVVTKQGRSNLRWRIRIRRNGPPADDIYSYAGPDLLDAADRLTSTGRDLIARDLSRRAKEASAQYCVVWSERSCTWFDSDGTPRNGFQPPVVDAAWPCEYAHVPLRLEPCHYAKLPKGSDAPYVCVRNVGRDYVEITPGDNVLIAYLDEEPREGDPHPAAGLVDDENYLIVPKTHRGVEVVEVRDGCNLYGPVQPNGVGEILRTPSPQDLREACERIAGRKLSQKIHQALWNAIDPVQWGMIQGGVTEAA